MKTNNIIIELTPTEFEFLKTALKDDIEQMYQHDNAYIDAWYGIAEKLKLTNYIPDCPPGWMRNRSRPAWSADTMQGEQL